MLTNKVIYGDVDQSSDKTRMRRLQSAGHCYRHKEEPTSILISWTPTRGKNNTWKQGRAHNRLIRHDVDVDVEVVDLPSIDNNQLGCTIEVAEGQQEN